MIDRRALRALMGTIAHDGFEIDRFGLDRVIEVLEAAAMPGLRNLTGVAEHHARKRGRKVVKREDVDSALAFIRQNGLSEGAGQTLPPTASKAASASSKRARAKARSSGVVARSQSTLAPK